MYFDHFGMSFGPLGDAIGSEVTVGTIVFQTLLYKQRQTKKLNCRSSDDNGQSKNVIRPRTPVQINQTNSYPEPRHY